MRRIVWTPLARDDLAAIDGYWWQNNPIWADELLGAHRIGRSFLTGAPHAGPLLEQGSARKWTVRHTGYVLVYRLGKQQIEILSGHHGRQNWRNIE